jgi:hypothetical protein
MQNSHFHHASENGLQYFLRIPKHGKHDLPNWWRELGYLHFTEARFDSCCLWCTHDSSPVTIVLSILVFSPSTAYRKRRCKDRPIRFIFSRSFSSLGKNTMRALPETSKDHSICCMLNHGNTLVQLLHCLSSFSHLESTVPPAAQLLLSHYQQGGLEGYHMLVWNVLERHSRPSCELLYATNTSHRKREIFLYEYSLHWVILPTKNTQQNAVLRYYTPQTLSSFWLLKPAAKYANERLLLRLS